MKIIFPVLRKMQAVFVFFLKNLGKKNVLKTIPLHNYHFRGRTC